jgi:LemA protein
VGISTEKILHRLYPGANRPAGRPGTMGSFVSRGPLLQGVRRLDPSQSPTWARRLFAWSCVALLVVWFAFLWYYHNVFVAMTSTIDGDWADCEVMMQSRTHIRVNLSHMIVAYAQHERDLMTKITELRVGKPLQPADAKPAAEPAAADSPAAPAKPLNPAAVAKELDQLGPKQIAELLSRIQVVAEQYPQLKLTENFQQLSKSTIETEHKIADLLIQYNRDVNAYMTVRSCYPGRHFAWILNFPPKQFISVEPENMQFREVTF